ncbi:dual specificity tyrosine-phosphorylation-regulated kinase, partial [Aphelenchoides avenae]
MDNLKGFPLSGQRTSHASVEWFESVWEERGLDKDLMRKLYEHIKGKLMKKILERYEKAMESDNKDARSELHRVENDPDQQAILAPRATYPVQPAAAPQGCKRQAAELQPVAPKKNKVVDFIDLTADSGLEGSGGLRAKNVLGLHVKMLTPFEWSEISSYGQVYYVGCHAKRKIWGVLDGPRNCGYDNKLNGYRVVLRDHIAYRYEVLDTLGKGSFGQVVKAFDHKSKQLVALKIIRNEPRFSQQAVQEVDILSRLRDLDHARANIIRMLDHFTFRNHRCITFELAGLNLYEYVRQNQFRGMKPVVAAKIVNSILQSLALLHSEDIIHADLKPENILLQHASGTEIKVIDFGSSCYVGKQIYSYIQSRYYRAPE